MSFADRKNQLLQPAPILSFWDLDTVHVVDFGDRDGASTVTPSTLRFDGVDYVPAKLSLSERSESTEGGESSVVVAVEDPGGSIARALQLNGGFVGQRVTLRQIYYDKIADPTQAVTQIFILRAPTCTDSGIAFTLGHPSLIEAKTPRRFFSRTGCWNDYHSRHIAGNRCTMPSDWFTYRTKQRFKNRFVGAGETQQKFGWWTLNANNASVFETGYSQWSAFLKTGMEITSTSGSMSWGGASRSGPFAYKKISGDFDVRTNYSLSASVRTDYIAGLLCQGETTLGHWVHFGAGQLGGSTGSDSALRLRSTVADVSSDFIYHETGLSSYRELRMRRVGDVFSLFYGPSNSEALNPFQWVHVRDVSVSMSAAVRIGLMLSSDSAVTSTAYSAWQFLHFFSGGPATCDRTLATCTLYANANDYNGFNELPDVRVNT